MTQDTHSPAFIINDLLAKHFAIRVEQQDVLLAYIRVLEAKAEMFTKLLEVVTKLEDMVRKPQYKQVAERVNAFMGSAALLVEADRHTKGGKTNPEVYNLAVRKYNASAEECRVNALADIVWLLKNLAPVLQNLEKFINENPGTEAP